jgi:hypothetical protein
VDRHSFAATTDAQRMIASYGVQLVTITTQDVCRGRVYIAFINGTPSFDVTQPIVGTY